MTSVALFDVCTSVMSDKNGAFQIYSGKKLSPKLSKQPLFATVKKKIVFVTSEKNMIFFHCRQ